ncbi:CBM35 domain-containing protein, partial [Streptomyces tricolor]
VVIGIGIAMINGNTDDDKSDDQANSTPTQSQPGSPTPSGSKSAPSGELPKVDGADKSLQLVGGATGASDVSGARSADGSYIGGLNQAGASVTWTVNDIPKSGKYTVYVGYTVPGKDGSVTLMVNGTASERPVDLKNWRHAAEGDYEKGWTKTYNWIQLNKGTNTITLSCGQGNQCDALIDQMWLVKGWVNS